MYYHELKNLLDEASLTFATKSDILCIDEYLASLNNAQAMKVTPWQVAKRTGVAFDTVIELLLQASKLNLLSIRYEVWHPITRISLFATFDKARINQPIECSDEPTGVYIPTDHDIHISFRLNQILDVTDIDNSKKKAVGQAKSSQQGENINHQTSELTLDHIKSNSRLSQAFHDCTISINNVSQSGSDNNVVTSGGIAKQAINKESEHKNSMLSLMLKHPIISSVIAAIIAALICATPQWESIINKISGDRLKIEKHANTHDPAVKIETKTNISSHSKNKNSHHQFKQQTKVAINNIKN